MPIVFNQLEQAVRQPQSSDWYIARQQNQPVVFVNPALAGSRHKLFTFGSLSPDLTYQGTGNPPAGGVSRYGYHIRSGSPGDYAAWKTPTINPNVGTGDFTFGARVRMPAALGTYNAIAAFGSFNPGFYVRLGGSAWGIYWGADRAANTALSAGVWYTLIACRRSGVLHFYVDGVKEANTHSVGTSLGASVMTLGGNGATNVDTDLEINWYGFWRHGFSDAEARQAHHNPWGLLARYAPQFWAAAGGGTTVNLTGASSTGAAGTPTVTGAASVTVTGASSTGAVGTMTATGAAIAAITGTSATGSAGTLTATGAANITITGVSSTGQVGSLSVTVGGAVTVGLTGVSATGRVGLPTVTGAASVNITGASATGQPGTITATVGGTTVVLTGAGATGRVGTLSITGAANIAMSGASATGAAGSLSVTIPGSEAHIVATITITPAIGGTLELQPAIDGTITIN